MALLDMGHRRICAFEERYNPAKPCRSVPPPLVHVSANHGFLIRSGKITAGTPASSHQNPRKPLTNQNLAICVKSSLKPDQIVTTNPGPSLLLNHPPSRARSVEQAGSRRRGVDVEVDPVHGDAGMGDLPGRGRRTATATGEKRRIRCRLPR
jgi:hypothetical protein